MIKHTKRIERVYSKHIYTIVQEAIICRLYILLTQTIIYVLMRYSSLVHLVVNISSSGNISKFYIYVYDTSIYYRVLITNVNNTMSVKHHVNTYLYALPTESRFP